MGGLAIVTAAKFDDCPRSLLPSLARGVILLVHGPLDCSPRPRVLQRNSHCHDRARYDSQSGKAVPGNRMHR